MDDLKRFLKMHEAEMEVDVPDANAIWQQIEGKAKKPAPAIRKLFVLTIAAASIVIIVSIGFFKTSQNTTVTPEKPLSQQSAVAERKDSLLTSSNITALPPIKEKKQDHSKPRVTQIDNPPTDYVQLVNFQLKKLRTMPVYAEDATYFTGFQQQLQQMNADEAVLQSDIQTYGLNNRIIEALADLYAQKLKLLKQLQSEINQMNKSVHYKTMMPGQHPFYLNL